MEYDQILKIVFLILVLCMIFPSFLYYSKRSSFSQTVRMAGIWVIIGLAAAIAYSLFDLRPS
jgi:hypothetical protein